MNRTYIVSTHLGKYATVATSKRGALNNIRYRLYGASDRPWEMDYWTVEEVTKK